MSWHKRDEDEKEGRGEKALEAMAWCIGLATAGIGLVQAYFEMKKIQIECLQAAMELAHQGGEVADEETDEDAAASDDS